MLAGIYFAMVIISFLTSLTAYFQKGAERYLKLFPLLLLVTILVELGAKWLQTHQNSRFGLYILYNSFGCIEFPFYMYVAREIIRNVRVKKIILIAGCIYLLLGITNILFVQKTTSFNSITYAIGCLFIAVSCFYYFFELFQQSYSVVLVRQPAFWICAGLLFYYTCSFPIFGLLNFLSSNPIGKNIQVIIILLNVFLYSSFTIAFLCRLRVRNSTS